jgi:hypothetical protein
MGEARAAARSAFLDELDAREVEVLLRHGNRSDR